MTFDHPLFFLFFLPVVYLFIHIITRGEALDGYPVSVPPQRKLRTLLSRKVTNILLFLFITALIIAGTGPRIESSRVPLEEKGHAFMICLDVSSSMKALDFNPRNRLDVAKERIRTFVLKRKSDFFGLILFAKYAVPYVPLTFDNEFLLEKLPEIYPGIIEDGTSIGNAIISAVDQLKNYSGESKNIILVTDGINNSGYVSPLLAAEYAKKYRVSIYPVAIGSDQEVPFPFKDSKGLQFVRKISIPVDYEMLNDIAYTTGVDQIWKGDTTDAMTKAFAEIDKKRPLVLNVRTYIHYKQLYPSWLTASFILFLMFLASSFINLKLEY